jgi:hypothetical protein
LFKGKLAFALLSLLLTVAVVLSGCSSPKSPKEALQASMSKSSDMKSYSFKGSAKFEDINFPQEGMSAEESAAMLNTFKNAELTWTGAYRADPMLMEINMQLALKGDLAINFAVPIVMNKEKIWVKIPNIPMLPIPETVVGKFLEVDLKKLAEESGEPLPNLDVAKQQKFVNDMLAIVFKHLDEKTYLTSVKVKDAGLPEDAEVNQVVRFNLDKAKLEPFLKTIIEKIAPEILDTIAKNTEYRDMLGMKQEDIDSAQKGLKEVQGENLNKGMEEMKKAIKSLDITSNIGTDKKDFLTYYDATIKAALDIEGQSGNFTLKTVNQMNNINKEVKFEVGEPKGDSVITMEQMQEQMGGMFGAEGTPSL